MVLNLGGGIMRLQFCQWRIFNEYKKGHPNTTEDVIEQVIHYGLKPLNNQIYIQFTFNDNTYRTYLSFPSITEPDTTFQFFQNQKLIKRTKSFLIKGVFVEEGQHFWMVQAQFNHVLPDSLTYDEFIDE